MMVICFAKSGKAAISTIKCTEKNALGALKVNIAKTSSSFVEEACSLVSGFHCPP